MKIMITLFFTLTLTILTSQTYGDGILVYFNTDEGTQNSIAAADFDNDGLKDILMAGANPNVFWVKNLGDNEFGSKIEIFDDEIFGETAQPTDFDGDGNMDIVAACSFSNVVVTIRGNGDGTFEEAVFLETDLEPLEDLIMFDINGDGLEDIIYGTHSSVDDEGYIYYNKNNGAGSFDARVRVASDILGTTNMTCADIDGDFIPDLISKSFWDDKFVWFKNDGNGNFEPEQEVRAPVS